MDDGLPRGKDALNRATQNQSRMHRVIKVRLLVGRAAIPCCHSPKALRTSLYRATALVVDVLAARAGADPLPNVPQRPHQN